MKEVQGDDGAAPNLARLQNEKLNCYLKIVVLGEDVVEDALRHSILDSQDSLLHVSDAGVSGYEIFRAGEAGRLLITDLLADPLDSFLARALSLLP